MSGKRYTEEFKIEAVKQVTDRGYSVLDVADRLGVTTKSLYEWIKRYGDNAEQYQAAKQKEDEIRRLKADLMRVTEERDILKRPHSTLPRSPGEVRIYQATRRPSSSQTDVPGHGYSPERLLRLEEATCIRPSKRQSTTSGVD